MCMLSRVPSKSTSDTVLTLLSVNRMYGPTCEPFGCATGLFRRQVDEDVAAALAYLSVDIQEATDVLLDAHKMCTDAFSTLAELQNTCHSRTRFIYVQIGIHTLVSHTYEQSTHASGKVLRRDSLL